MGKWMDKRIPLFQCGYWLLDRWGAQEGDLLGRTWPDRSSGYRLVVVAEIPERHTCVTVTGYIFDLTELGHGKLQARERFTIQ